MGGASTPKWDRIGFDPQPFQPMEEQGLRPSYRMHILSFASL